MSTTTYYAATAANRLAGTSMTVPARITVIPNLTGPTSAAGTTYSTSARNFPNQTPGVGTFNDGSANWSKQLWVRWYDTPVTLPGAPTSQTIRGTIGGVPWQTIAATMTVTVQSGTTAPSVPRSPRAVSGDGTAAVSWTAPLANGGAAVTGYRVTASPGGTSCTTTGATSCAVPGLNNGTTYTFTVTATNSAGTSAGSTATWPVTPQGTAGGGTTFSTFTSQRSLKRMEVLDGTDTVVQNAPAAGSNQQWEVRAAGAYVNLVNRATGQCATVTGASTANNATVTQSACGNATNQQWTLTDVGGGYLQIIARHSGKCLDVPGASLNDGVGLIQYTCSTTGATSQRWQRG